MWFKFDFSTVEHNLAIFHGHCHCPFSFIALYRMFFTALPEIWDKMAEIMQITIQNGE